jgi:hypothetical protein
MTYVATGSARAEQHAATGVRPVEVDNEVADAERARLEHGRHPVAAPPVSPTASAPKPGAFLLKRANREAG